MTPSISREQLRGCVLEALAKATQGQMGDLYRAVAEVFESRRRGSTPQASSNFGMPFGRFAGTGLSDADGWHVQEVFWDLLIEGIVRPGSDPSNLNLPYYHVTEMGMKQVKGVDMSPYDPDGYLHRIQTQCPGLDPVILTYLTECLHTFRIGCMLSAAITLGCASEKALLNLVEAYAEALPEDRKASFVKKTAGQQIRRQWDEFGKALEGHLNALLPGGVRENLDTALVTLFNVFRTHRNEAGHPTGKVLTREESYAQIMAFPLYLRKVHELINWLKANPDRLA